MALADLSNTKTRAIIICAGEATRWANYMGVKKHFIEVEGEAILHRTVRLLNEYGIDDIGVVAKDDEYNSTEYAMYKPVISEHNGGVDKFLNSQHLWLNDGRTIVLYGDVYFTEYAMQTIANHAHRDWQLFARAFGSRYTGRKWGECFAQSFYPEHIAEHLRKLEQAVELWHEGKIKNPSGWQHYRFMIGLPPEMVDTIMVGDRFVNIDDLTDDFDSKEDYDLWLKGYNKWK